MVFFDMIIISNKNHGINYEKAYYIICEIAVKIIISNK